MRLFEQIVSCGCRPEDDVDFDTILMQLYFCAKSIQNKCDPSTASSDDGAGQSKLKSRGLTLPALVFNKPDTRCRK